jgi:hypothetical protein
MDSPPNVTVPAVIEAPKKEKQAKVEETNKSQPWKQYLNEIRQMNEENPLKKELFKVGEGFNDHSLAG